jgi:hypothetical protein
MQALSIKLNTLYTLCKYSDYHACNTNDTVKILRKRLIINYKYFAMVFFVNTLWRNLNVKPKAFQNTVKLCVSLKRITIFLLPIKCSNLKQEISEMKFV